MNQELINIIDYYKEDSIDKDVAEKEIAKCLSLNNVYIDVLIDDLENKNNSSYIAMVVPEKRSDVFRETFVIDKNIILNILPSNKVALLIELMEASVPTMNSLYYNFLHEHFETETSFLECIQLFIKLYCNFIINISDDTFPEISDFKEFVQQDTSNILLAIQSENESSDKIVNHILLNHTLPKFALTCAETLFKQINIPSTDVCPKVEDQDFPESNIMYAETASHSTGTINPEWRKDIDPLWIPD